MKELYILLAIAYVLISGLAVLNIILVRAVTFLQESHLSLLNTILGILKAMKDEDK
jgi:flagellar biosynthesis protein FliQ